jgi:hypothetical protein
MNCGKTDSLLNKYMDGSLTPKDEKALKEHVVSCEKCKEEYLVYGEMLSCFASMTEFDSAPPGFTERVMGEIRKLPSVTEKAANKRDNFIYFIWAVVSGFLGLCLVLTIYKDGIISQLNSNENLAAIINIFKPVSDSISNIATEAVEKIASAMDFLSSSFSSYKFYLLAACCVFGIAYYLRRRPAKSKNNNFRNGRRR